MMIFFKKVLFLLILSLLQGCFVQGIIYRKTISPYSKDFFEAPKCSKKCVIESRRLQEPVSGYGLSAQWQLNEIQRVAREQGIGTIHYIDVEKISIVLGIYQEMNFIIYGE